MASYTMQLKTYIEMFSQYEEGLSHREKIEIGRKKLFDFDYPIFDTAYKKILETNIIRNFYFREIGFETEGMFKFYLESFMQLNMPYFNRLFESEMLNYDPLINSEMNVTHNIKKDKDQKDNRKIDQDSRYDSTEQSKKGEKHDVTSDITDTSKGDSFSRDIQSDTPDSRLRLTTGQEGTGVIEYASKINENKGLGNSTSRKIDKTRSNLNNDINSSSTAKSSLNSKDDLLSNINEIEDFIEHRQGKIGVQTYPEMVKKYRESFLRIEKQIHQELQNLFMLVY